MKTFNSLLFSLIVALSFIFICSAERCRPLTDPDVGPFFDGSQYDYCAVFVPRTYVIFWNIGGGNLTVAIQAEASGWVGLGLAEVGRDLIVGWVDGSGDGSVYDYHDHNPATFLDTQQDVSLTVNGATHQIDGITTIEWTRLLTSSDPNDEDVSININNPIRLNFALKTADPTDPSDIGRHDILNASEQITFSSPNGLWNNLGPLPCIEGYFGAECNSTCPGITATYEFEDICSGNGLCDDNRNGTGICDCNASIGSISTTSTTTHRQISSRQGTGLFYGEACDVPCPAGCSVDCDQVTGACVDCAPGYYSAPECLPCPSTCAGNGYCDKTNGQCICFTGFSGTDCSIGEAEPLNLTFVAIGVGALIVIVSFGVVLFQMQALKKPPTQKSVRSSTKATSEKSSEKSSEKV